VREDAPNTEANLRKLAAGRVQHVLIGKSHLDYRLKLADPPLALHPALEVSTYMGQCAVSPAGRISLAEVNRSIWRMQDRDVVGAIVARYK
jgi:polar amino acid transport system substrate-binding protein